MTGLTWGVFVPHGAAGDMADWAPQRAWAHMKSFAAEADRLGYDHLWLGDHLMTSMGDRGGLNFEAYTTMAALGQVTSRAKLGALVTCALYRSPGMLAKEAANVHATSGGRLIFALGGGWDEGEFAAYGYDFPGPGARVTAFAETLEAVRRLWSEDSVDFAGDYVHLTGAKCNPRPETMPSIWTGTHGPRGLSVAARFADVANWNCGLDDFKRLSGILREKCAETGRTVETSVFRLADLSPDCSVTKSFLAAQGAPPEALDTLKSDHFIGSVQEVLPKVQNFVNEGASHIIILALDQEEGTETARRFIEEVVPAVTTG